MELDDAQRSILADIVQMLQDMLADELPNLARFEDQLSACAEDLYGILEGMRED